MRKRYCPYLIPNRTVPHQHLHTFQHSSSSISRLPRFKIFCFFFSSTSSYSSSSYPYSSCSIATPCNGACACIAGVIPPLPSRLRETLLCCELLLRVCLAARSMGPGCVMCACACWCCVARCVGVWTQDRVEKVAIRVCGLRCIWRSTLR